MGLLLWAAKSNAQDVLQADLNQLTSTLSVVLDESDTGCNYYLTYNGTLTSSSSYADDIPFNGEEIHYSRTTDTVNKIITVTIYHNSGVSGTLELEELTFTGSSGGIADLVEW